MSKIIQPFFYVVAVAGFAYYAYRMIKSGLEPPPEEGRNLIIGYDDDGTPIVDPYCDIDRTLDFWKEQNRLFRSA